MKTCVELKFEPSYSYAGADPEISEKGGGVEAKV